MKGTLYIMRHGDAGWDSGNRRTAKKGQQQYSLAVLQSTKCCRCLSPRCWCLLRFTQRDAAASSQRSQTLVCVLHGGICLGGNKGHGKLSWLRLRL